MAEVRKSITALYRDFEAAHSAVQEERETKGNVAVCRKIAAGIVKLPAEDIDEMILKIRVALRCTGRLRSGETLASIDSWKAGKPDGTLRVGSPLFGRFAGFPACHTSH